MLHDPILIAPSVEFWPLAARAILAHPALAAVSRRARDWSTFCVVVPTMTHAQQLKASFGLQTDGSVILPRIITLSAWLAEQPPQPADAAPASASERLMSLYAELRQHAWLKKLFGARRNTDLLPLAKTLLCLSDELTQSLLPQLRLAPDAVESLWQQALAQLSPDAEHALSGEAQLVWSVWQSQLERNDACALRYARMMELASNANMPLVWIAPAEMDAFDQSFLAAYSQRQPVLPIVLDWRAAAVHSAYALAWQELIEPDNAALAAPLGKPDAGISVSLCKAAGLESEAQQGAQTVINWIAAGKTSIAIVAQDRVVARRIRALLERAQIRVADETGWKLSTTRAAAAMAAWLEVVASRAETVAMLDLLKSPYVFAQLADKADCVMRIEAALRRANVLGGWKAIGKALEDMPQELDLVARIAEQARQFTKRKTVQEWIAATIGMLRALDMEEALAKDPAGVQLRTVLDALQLECGLLEQPFSFAEWRALVSLHMESTDFAALEFDRRVVMLPLNGARLRAFDAVLLVGADAEHLPSQPNETLFFANAVRRELGLATRERLQRQQLRDFAELLSANSEVVLSWQESRDGEPNPVSPWIERLELTLARHGMPKLPIHVVEISRRELTSVPPAMPAPSAPQLLPKKLSASAYNTLAACPYQFFAQRMLGLTTLDELSDLPQKRDYGDWLHQILNKYHEAVSERKVNYNDRAALLQEISDQIFQPILEKSPAALGYYVRWQKVMPAYLDWANERESQGWRFAIGERWFEKKLPLPHGDMLLHGRIDRIDENEAGEWAVLDYKTASHTTLKGRLGKCEDHQLAFYGLIAEKPVSAAHYVALELTKDKTGDVAAPNYDRWQHQLSAQIVDNLRAISMGATLPAAGIEAICQYCDVRGLCRKGTW